MSEFQTLHEIVKAARANLPDGPWDYLVGAAETETTHIRNRLAIDALAFRPRVLRDVSKIDCSSTFMGKPMRIPVFLAPMGSLHTLGADGALAVAKGAERFGVMSFLSSVALPGLEEVAAGTKHPKVFQLYVRGDRAWVADHIRRAIDCGYHGFCFTVDTAIYSRRERDILKRYLPAGRRSASGFNYQSAMSWELVKWFKDKYPLPLILKGIATAEDAELAVEHGVDVVYVSNHGGRQLDHGAGAIDLLAEVLKAVGGKAEVVVDGGFLRGTDVVKAIALGAKAVGVGRLHGFGLAAAGEVGVARVLELLEIEIQLCMGLLGVRRLEELNPRHLRPAQAVRTGSLASAFPFLKLEERPY
ncbi:MAG: alpha-hydroxy-acid oxidizing protein [Betaproteobacteria bacterium]|nr:alpha-hydroxy-acid oxidizing protein [Betaproteobacteria bacterium]MBI2961373.1 alpha-hydroxy-acid oxidizing protein [Betaproteobacteria bacterium]